MEHTQKLKLWLAIFLGTLVVTGASALVFSVNTKLFKGFVLIPTSTPSTAATPADCSSLISNSCEATYVCKYYVLKCKNSLSISSPAERATVSLTQQIKLQNSNAQYLTDRVTFDTKLYVDGVVVNAPRFGSDTFDWDTTKVSNGDHTLYIEAAAKAPVNSTSGETYSGKTPFITVTVKNVSPAPAPTPTTTLILCSAYKLSSLCTQNGCVWTPGTTMLAGTCGATSKTTVITPPPPPPPPPTGATLQVTPTSSFTSRTLAAGSTGEVASFDLKNTSVTAIKVTGLSLTMKPATPSLSAFTLITKNNGPYSGTVSNDKISWTINPLLIAAGESAPIIVSAKVDSAASAGSVLFSMTPPTDITAVSTSGGITISPTTSITSPGTPDIITAAPLPVGSAEIHPDATQSSTLDVKQSTSTPVMSFNITNTTAGPITPKTLTLQQTIASGGTENFKDLTVAQDGTSVSQPQQISSSAVTFTIAGNPIAAGQTSKITVSATAPDTVGEKLSLALASGNIIFKNADNSEVAVTGLTAPLTGSMVKVLTASIPSDEITPIVTVQAVGDSAAQGAQATDSEFRVMMLKFTAARGQAKINKITISMPQATGTSMLTYDRVAHVRLTTSANGVNENSTFGLIPLDATGRAVFNGTWTLPQDTPQYLVIRAKLKPEAEATRHFSLGIQSSNEIIFTEGGLANPGIAFMSNDLVVATPIVNNDTTVQEELARQSKLAAQQDEVAREAQREAQRAAQQRALAAQQQTAQTAPTAQTEPAEQGQRTAATEVSIVQPRRATRSAAVVPTLAQSQRLVRAPERGNAGPETMIYVEILAAIQAALYLKRRLTK